MLENKNRNNAKSGANPWWRPALLFFSRLSIWIAFPVILATFLGKWLDEKFASAPWLTLFTVSMAFIISLIGLVKETAKEYKKIEKDLPDRE